MAKDKKIEEIPGFEEKNGFYEKSELYPEFPVIKIIKAKIDALLQTGREDADFLVEMEHLMGQLQAATEILDLSLQNQEQYGLVDKRWMRRPGFMKEALEKGRLVMELDLRPDKEGNFWVSHAMGSGRTFFPPMIRNLSTEEMHQKSSRFSLEEALALFSRYKRQGHKLILEIKSLGPGLQTHGRYAENLQAVLKAAEVQDSVAVASLSPAVLMATHKVMGDMPLILNGGIVPGISYNAAGEKFAEAIVPQDMKWRAFGLKPFGEVVVSASNEAVRRPDGQDVHTGYALTRLPREMIDVFREQRKEGHKLGGLVSLSSVTILASVLDGIGAKRKAQELRSYYSRVMDELGVGKMATTWGQSLGKIPVLRNLNPREQLRTFKKELGLDTVVYTKSPEEWAHLLPKEVNDLLK